MESLVFDLAEQPSLVRMRGAGAPGVIAQLLANETIINTTTVGLDGAWSLITPLENPAQYDIGLTALLSDGQAVAVTVPMNALVLSLPTATETATVAPTATPTPIPTPTIPAPTVGEFIFTRNVTTTIVTPTPPNTRRTRMKCSLPRTCQAPCASPVLLGCLRLRDLVVDQLLKFLGARPSS